MNEQTSARVLPGLRRYLLIWFGICALLMVVAYTQLLEYYLQLGIDLRTETFLELTAKEYAQSYVPDADDDARQKLPTGSNLAGFRNLAELPPQIGNVFDLDSLQHGEALRFVNLDIDNDKVGVPIDTRNLCQGVNCDLIYLYPYQLRGEQWLYLVHGVVGSDKVFAEIDFTEQAAFVIGSVFTMLFLLMSFFAIRSIDKPLRKLDQWSAELSSDSTALQVPDLRFQEFDSLARRLKYAFERMRQGVVKEQTFLRHASHELRTPIAILSANVELLDRLIEQKGRTEAEQASLQRQYRALDDIQLLIETLLWVNDQSDNLPSSESLDLRTELESIVANYRYLLDARTVTVSLEGEESTVLAPAAAVRIVLSNLVRNAFQYTYDGEVLIALSAAQVSVQNTNTQDVDDDSAAQSSDEYGFGLGLELVARICNRFEWQYETTELPLGRRTTIRF